MRRVVCTLLLLAFGWCDVAAAATPTITEFSNGITPGSGVQGIALGPDGNMWFTEFGASKIGRITPAGVVTEFPLSGDPKPYDIVAGHDGTMWFTAFNTNQIGRIATDGALLAPIPLAAGAAPIGIATDRGGRIWVAENGIDKIARFTPSPPGLFEDGGGIAPGNGPRRIVSGADNAMWFTQSGTMNLGRHGLPVSGSTQVPFVSGEGLATDPDGNFWTVRPSANSINGILLDSGGGTVTNGLLNAGSFPQDITTGPDGRVWFTETNGNRIGRMSLDDFDTKEFGAGISPGRAPFDIAAGPDGALWFTEFAGGIGRITTEEEPFGFTSPARLTFPGAGGGASQYPAPIQVSGLSGTVTRVQVRLTGVIAQRPDDLGALLVDPGGRAVLLFKDAGVGSDANGAALTFADDGRTLSAFVSGRYAPRPERFTSLKLPAPAPGGPYSSSLSTFNGADPNGEWKLFLTRLIGGSSTDVVAGGWSLDIDTAPPQTIQVPVPGPTQTVTVPGPTQTITVPAPPDTRRASVKLSRIASSTTLAKLLKGVSLTVTPDEPVSLSVSLIGTQKSATLAAVRVALFEKALGLSSAPRTVKLKPSKSALGSSRKSFKLTLRVDATDRGGNGTRIDRPLRVTVPKKKRR